MNSTEVRELLERAAVWVAPSEVDPASRMVGLGRRSVRRRRGWAAAGSVAAAVVAVVALPLVMATPDRSDPGGTVSAGGLSVAVPKGWRTSKVPAFDPCTAEPHTVYLAERVAPAGATPTCNSGEQAWVAVMSGVGQTINPERLVVKDDQLLLAEQPDRERLPFLWSYRVYNQEVTVTGVFISGNDKGREGLLKRVTWPAGSATRLPGGLALPKRITSATTDVPPNNGMVVATDAKTLNLIRTELAELRDPVPAGAECTLQKPGSVGISVGEVIVVLGDATCPQAISTGGGRVQAPPGLGKELLDLIVASDRATTERAMKD